MTLLRARNLSLSLGGTPILKALDLSVKPGEVVGLIGPNGVGKTTLLRALAGLLTPDHGEVEIEAQNLRTLDRKRLAGILAYLPQGGLSHWDMETETLVMLGRLPHRGAWQAPSQADRAAVERALRACDLCHLRRRPVTQLSGGERSRVLLARALATEPKLLLADEPVAGLDPGHQLDVMAKLRRLASTGAAVIVVMHDLTLAARFCSRLILLHRGEIAAEGCPQNVLSAEILARCYGIHAYCSVVQGIPIIVPLERSDACHDQAST